MSVQLPEKPWTKGDSFKVEETGLVYEWNGEAWLSDGAALPDELATKVQLEEVDRTAIMRDDELKKEHNEDSAKQSAINAGVVVSLDELFWRDVELGDAIEAGDKKLQDQIDAIEIPKTDLSGYVSKNDSWDMSLGSSLSVNVLKNVDGGTPFVYYEGDPEGTHPCGIVNRYMLQDYVNKKIDELGSPEPELPKFKMVAGGYSDWDKGSIAFLDANGKDTTTMNSTRTIILSSFDVDGKRWGRDEDCMEYVKHFNGHVNVTSEDGYKTLFNMSPHYNAKCELLHWPGDEEFPYAGYVIQWQGFQSYTVTSPVSEWSVGAFYRLSIPEIFF